MAATQTACKPPPKRPGLKKGQKHSGSFKSGYDPRRVVTQVPGKRAWTDQLAEALDDSVPAAVEFLKSAVLDESKADNIRLIASQEILDRRFGKAVSRDVSISIGQPQGAVQADGRPPAALTNDALDSIINQAVAALEAPSLEGDIVDAEVVAEA